jgi:steroid Delta-isomerase
MGRCTNKHPAVRHEHPADPSYHGRKILYILLREAARTLWSTRCQALTFGNATLTADTAPPASRRTNMGSRETIQSAVATYLAATGALDADAVAEAFAPDGVSNDPVGTPAHAGRDAIRQFMQWIFTKTETATVTSRKVFVAGDSAAFDWTVQLTTKQGQSVTFEGIDVIQVNDDGKIQTLHAYWDPTPVLAVFRS